MKFPKLPLKFPKLTLDTTKLLNLISIGCIALALIVGAWFGIRAIAAGVKDQAIVDNVDQPQDMCEFRRLLDGVCVQSEEEKNPKLVGIMIENAIEARPQYGLADARVVYEAPVEANFTRFFALFFSTQEVDQVGPVRSARPYYLDWLSEYGTPLYMHVGGSNEALATIKRNGVNDLNEFYHGRLFRRGRDRSAPHNVYTSSELWDIDYTELKRDYTDMTESWVFGDKEECVENCVASLSLSFNAPAYQATWKYASSTHDYVRSQSGALHKDARGKTITADTVIVQFVSSTVLDEIGRLSIDTIGTGKAIVFRDGYAIEGRWKKDSVSGRTRWYDENAIEIPLKAGKIWIEVANERTDFTMSF